MNQPTTQPNPNKASSRISSFWLVLALGVLVFGGFAAWFYYNYEQVVVTRTAPTKAAQNNRFLVAELTLNELGTPANTEFGRDKLVNLPSSKDVLIVNEIGASFNQSRIDAMVEWMENGGRIITFIDRRAYDNESEDHKPSDDYEGYHTNRLLDYFDIYGFEPKKVDSDNTINDKEASNAQSSATDDEAHNKTNAEQSVPTNPHNLIDNQPHHDREAVSDTLDGTPVTLYFDRSLSVDYYPDDGSEDYDGFVHGQYVKKTLNGRFALHMLQLKVGKGELTALSSRDFLTNPKFAYDETVKPKNPPKNEQVSPKEENDENTQATDDTPDLDDIADLIAAFTSSQVTSINEGDNAYLLWYLTQGADHVWLLPSIDAPSFWQILWQKARYACLAFLVLVMAWLLWQLGRFGPIKPLIETSRRSIVEHLQAQGNYFWRVDKAQKLLTQNRETLKLTLLRKHPSLQGLPQEKLCEKLAKTISLTAEEINNALYRIPANESQFIADSLNLKKLREHL